VPSLPDRYRRCHPPCPQKLHREYQSLCAVDEFVEELSMCLGESLSSAGVAARNRVNARRALEGEGAPSVTGGRRLTRAALPRIGTACARAS
jgi:hypothetical protein